MKRILQKYKLKLIFCFIIIGLTAIIDIFVLSYLSASLSNEMSSRNQIFQNLLDIGVIGGLILILFRFFLAIYSHTIQAGLVKNISVSVKEAISEQFLFSPYEKFENINSSDKTRLIVTETNNFTTNIVQYGLQAASDIIPVTLILAYLVHTMGIQTIVILPIFLGLILITIIFTRRKMENWGSKRLAAEKLQMGLTNFSMKAQKYIIANNKRIETQQDLLQSYERLGHANYMQIIYQTIPRFTIETIAFLSIIGLVYAVVETHILDLSDVIIIGVASLKVLPAANRIILSIQAVIFSLPILAEINTILKDKLEDDQPEKKSDGDVILVKNLTKNISKSERIRYRDFIIQKSEKAIIVGPSGSGKTTLMDLIAGVKTATSGTVIVPNRRLYYLTQDTFLKSGMLSELICDGNVFDKNKYNEVLCTAEIDWFSAEEQQNHDFYVSENGVNLSGGQRQRLALARAMYAEPEILLLDEATSGIDAKLEDRIFQKLLQSEMTIICVSHNEEIINKFDTKICLNT
jgi:HlyD family secretion protein